MVHDFAKKTDEIAVDIKSFLLSPMTWRTSRVKFPINWERIPFTEANRAKVPKKAGIYAFIVQHINDHFPGHGFIMYIGITGTKGKNRTLYVRYGDYLREQKTFKRPKVHYMLTKYPDDLHFAFSEIDTTTTDLAQLELDLNDAIIPPVAVKDFTAEIRAIVKALP
ncbi:hypothetical protein AAHH43_001358 [Pseudomonas aeruginosa]|uniref:hypothetical protein n=1 Tax=Pseudomonas aeruginosa TaxID=287 RepID=UPI0012450A5C|nr:hypothetical protein [Pseudomonas aeruginosa]KAB0740551.1 hypothetical protein F7O88_01715 [Pseudomonas aeruginosa]MCW5425253.1 hypothetical protein [Pseudomonas aeruginosa]MCW5431473.1 hypothetical protein [Pseudomonas aeruginosa]